MKNKLFKWLIFVILGLGSISYIFIKDIMMMSYSQFIKRSEKYFKSYDSMLRRNGGAYFLGMDNNIVVVMLIIIASINK